MVGMEQYEWPEVKSNDMVFMFYAGLPSGDVRV